MKQYKTKAEAPNSEIEEIRDELNKAQQMIHHCYARLDRLGLIDTTEKPPAETGDNSGAIKTTVQKSIRDTIQGL